MLCLFISVTLVCFRNFGISFALGNTRHRKIHTHFGALAFEVCTQTRNDFFVQTLRYAHFVNARKLELFILLDGNKFRRLADRADGNGIIYDLTANSTSFHDNNLS